MGWDLGTGTVTLTSMKVTVVDICPLEIKRIGP